MQSRKSHGDINVLDLSFSSPERRGILLFLDLLGLNGAFLLSLYLRPDIHFSLSLVARHPVWLLLLNALWLFFGYFFQVYDLEKAGVLRAAFPGVLQAAILTAGIFPFIPYLPPALPGSRAPLFITILLPVVFIAAGRAIYLLVFSQLMFRRRVLIIGAGWAGRTVAEAILEHGGSIYQLLGFVDDDPAKQDTILEIDYRDSQDNGKISSALPILGARKDLADLILHQRIATLVLAVTDDLRGGMLQTVIDTLQFGVQVFPMPVLYEQLTGKVPVQHIGDHWSVSMPVAHPGTQASWHFVKRLFDIFWASLGLVFLGLAYPVIALAIYIDSPGPILYTQERVGRYGKPYRVHKFRSMVVDAETKGAVWASENDVRVTRVGRLLRKLHIDEFPQFVNILKGEMSVVGPRPERPEFVEELAGEIPFYRVRHAVKPGMAGWGLIHQGYSASKQDALVKLQYDLYYIKHQSFWLDLYILERTIVDALTFRGR